MRSFQASSTDQPTTPAPPISPSAGGYEQDDRCRACGEHIAEPHAPDCPADTDE